MIKILELFGGIGACSKALERLGIDYEIADYVEIDKYAVKSFNALHNTKFEPQDICKWDKDIDVDLIMHGSPCQDFSLAGLQAGGDEGSGTRSSLMYETIRIVEKLKPKYVIWENVKNVISKKHRHNFDNYIDRMKQLGYTSYYQVLNAKDYEIPQNRERVFTISIRNDLEQGYIFPKKQELKLKLKDMLENNVEEKYYLSDKMIKYISATGTANFKNPDSRINLDIARPLTTDQNKRAGTTNYLSEELPSNYDLNKYIGTYDYAQSETLRPTDTSRLHIGKDISGSLLASGNHNGILIKNATKKGYLEATDGYGIDGRNLKEKLCDKLIENNIVKGGEIINHSYTNSTSRNTLDKYIETSNGITPTLTTRCDVLGVVVSNLVNKNEDKIKNGAFIETYNENVKNDEPPIKHNLRIRKLTPKECWRLMGFDDEDFEKAKQVNSDTQLCKQAGNSIVVNVLEAILYNLLVEPSSKEDKLIKGQTNIWDFINE